MSPHLRRHFDPKKVPAPSIAPETVEILSGICNQTCDPSLLDIEIGAGQGLHAIQYCKQNPERTLIAIERTTRKFQALLQRKVHHPDLKNLIPVHADAISIVSHFVFPNTIARIFMLYPNPNPKPKQANLRFHNSPFIGFLRTRLQQHGQINMATNLKWFADEAKIRMIEDWKFYLLNESQITHNQVLSGEIQPRTHFERKYLLSGQTCYDLVFGLTHNNLRSR